MNSAKNQTDKKQIKKHIKKHIKKQIKETPTEMKSNRKQGIYEISLTASKTVLFVLLAFCGLVFVIYGLICRGDIIQSEPVNFVENWDVVYS